MREDEHEAEEKKEYCDGTRFVIHGSPHGRKDGGAPVQERKSFDAPKERAWKHSVTHFVKGKSIRQTPELSL